MAAKANPLACPDANGHRDDGGGTAMCACDTGYADDATQDGDDCLTCAAISVNGEMPIQDYSQDGIRATLWFEVY